MKKAIKIIAVLLSVCMLSGCGSATTENVTLNDTAFAMGNNVLYLGDITVQDIKDAGGKITETETEDDKAALTFKYRGNSFMVFAENRTDAEDVSDYTVYQVYFYEGDFKVPGDLGIGDTLESFIETYGEPFSYTTGSDVSDTYDGITAYYFTSDYNADVVCVFMDDDTEEALSIRVTETVEYIVDLDDISDELIYAWINEYTDSWGYDYIADLEGSENLEFTTGDITWTNVSLALSETLSTSTTNILMVEFETTVKFDASDVKTLYFQQRISLEEEYTVYGCFYITDLSASSTEPVLYDTGYLYIDKDNMYEDIFDTDYTVSEREL